VFAVGFDGIFHYDGSVWSLMTATYAPATVWGTGPADVYAGDDNGQVIHYDGTGWTVVDFLDGPAAAIWGNDRYNVYVGGGGTTLNNLTHYDGFSWTSIGIGSSGEALTGVWGSGASDVYATDGLGMIEHFDGASWSLLGSTGVLLYAIGGSGAGDVYAVGAGGAIMHFGGRRWALMPAANAGLGFDDFYGVWGSGLDDVYAAGLAPLHFDGGGWHSLTSPFSGDAAWGSGPSDVFITESNPSGTVHHFDGSAWSSTDTMATLLAIFGTGPTNVYAVGYAGALEHYDGAAWTPMTSGTTVRLSGVWASAPSDVFVVGDTGTILHYDGTAWTPMTSGTIEDLMAVWGADAHDVFVAGTSGTILHYDGATWTPIPTGTTATLRGLFGEGPDDVIAVGYSGTILHYDGLTWSAERSPTGNNVIGVWGMRGRFFAVGGGGTLLAEGRACTPTETQCADGADDDCDGLYDCGDPDCATDSTCAAGGLCAGATPIMCSDTKLGTTSGALRQIDRYACDPWTEKGREQYYRYDAMTTGTVNVSLSGMTSDLDLIVLATGAGGGCEPRNPGCVTASSTTSSPEHVTFSAVAGQSYYLVVDGFAANAGSFTLSMTCP
jgi:hypothetical protein